MVMGQLLALSYALLRQVYSQINRVPEIVSRATTSAWGSASPQGRTTARPTLLTRGPGIPEDPADPTADPGTRRRRPGHPRHPPGQTPCREPGWAATSSSQSRRSRGTNTTPKHARYRRASESDENLIKISCVFRRSSCQRAFNFNRRTFNFN